MNWCFIFMCRQPKQLGFYSLRKSIAVLIVWYYKYPNQHVSHNAGMRARSRRLESPLTGICRVGCEFALKEAVPLTCCALLWRASRLPVGWDPDCTSPTTLWRLHGCTRRRTGRPVGPKARRWSGKDPPRKTPTLEARWWNTKLFFVLVICSNNFTKCALYVREQLKQFLVPGTSQQITRPIFRQRRLSERDSNVTPFE